MYLFQHGRVFRVVPSQRPCAGLLQTLHFPAGVQTFPGLHEFLGYPVLYTRRFEAGETSIPGVSQVSEKRFQLAEPYGAKLGDPAQRHPICNFPHGSDSSITDMIQTTTRRLYSLTTNGRNVIVP